MSHQQPVGTSSWTVYAPPFAHISMHEAGQVKSEVHELIINGTRQLIIDLAEVDFIDSTTLGILLGALKRLRSVNGALRIVVMHKDIKKTFSMTGLDRLMDTFDSLDLALAA